MIYTILSVLNIFVAAAMIVLILMQRGAGADAGAAFGGGSSGTVFGARGSATFLSRATAVLAAAFFVISLAMGIILQSQLQRQPSQDLGVMSGMSVPGETDDVPVTIPPGEVAVPIAPAEVPAEAAPAPAPATDAEEVPAQPAPAEEPAAQTDPAG